MNKNRYFQRLLYSLMRISAYQLLLVLLSVGISLARPVEAQQVLERKVTLQVADVEMKSVLTQLTRQTGVRFTYSSTLIKLERKVSLQANNQPLAQVLNELFRPFNINYSLNGNRIILSRDATSQATPVPEEVPTNATVEPNRTLRGTVTEADNGTPIPGANIVVKGTGTPDRTRGTTTDADGNFSLNISDAAGSTTLVISSIGFENSEVVVGNRTQLKISLKPDVKGLNEVVVVGYGVQKKATLTGAIGTVSGPELLRSPISNISNSLMGRVSGLTSIIQNGQPGKNAADIFIRGRATYGDAAAIVVVDGIERSDFGNIDPNEIESISVLKDASATAIFGIRGANGVIVVTTKSGKESKPKVSYTGNVALNFFTGFPKILDSYNSATLLNEGLTNEGFKPLFTQDELQKFKDGSEPIRYPNVNWYDAIMRKYNVQTQHNINITGGTKVAKYYLSAGYLYEDGLFKSFPSPYNIRSTNDYTRYNFRSNIDLSLSRDLQIGIRIGGRLGRRYQPIANIQNHSSAGIYLYRALITQSYAFPITLPDGRIAYNTDGGGGRFNIYGLLTRSGYEITQSNQIESTFNLNYKLDRLTPGLSFKTIFGYDNTINNATNQLADFAAYTINRKTGEITLSPEPQFRADNPLMGLNSTNTGNVSYNLQTGFDYVRNFDKHNVTGLLLLTRRLNQVTGADAPNALQGLASRITYNYANKYFVELNGAYNGSENFPQGLRYGLFPAISAGWILTTENFFKRLPAITYLKIRGSYGLVGNDRIGTSRFLYLDEYAVRTNAPAGDQPWSRSGNNVQFGNPNSLVNYPTVVHSRIGNPIITWEKGLKRNIGFESSFFKGALEFNLDLFDENRTNILLARQSGLVTYGEGYPNLNFGEVYNKGYEAELRYQTKVGNLTMGIGGQVSYAKNKIVSRDEPFGRPEYQKQAGKPIGQFIGYQTEGFYQSQDDINASPKSMLGPVIPGDLKFRDYNGDGAITPDDRVPIGYSDVPQYTYSFSPTLAWKGLSLNVLFQGTENVNTSLILTENWYEFMLNRWTPENAANATWPALRGNYANPHSYSTNDYLLQDNSYLKLRNVELAWQLPTRWTQALRLSAMRVYFTGTNLYTWTKFKMYYDPEVVVSNPEYVRQSQYPTSRNFNVGVNIQF